ncbi:MAG: hypothetical protein DCC54_05060 [Anaerolineae bacterium]|nr:MAG: hypothetical protein DCC54_05060 [Anaerolineae bacterium]
MTSRKSNAPRNSKLRRRTEAINVLFRNHKVRACILCHAGLWMAFAVPFPLMTPWILASIILYLLIAALGVGVYVPIFRKQLKLAESEGTDSEAYRKTARLGMILIFVVTFLVALIVFCMVVKPPLWSGWF